MLNGSTVRIARHIVEPVVILLFPTEIPNITAETWTNLTLSPAA